MTVVNTSAGDSLSPKEQVVVQAMSSGQRKTIVDDGSDAQYLSSGYLLYVKAGTLFAARFDVSRLMVTGDAVPVVPGIRRVVSPAIPAAEYAVSDTGTLVYVPGAAMPGQQRLFLFDRQGRSEPINVPAGLYDVPRVSPNGRRLAFQTMDRNESAISVYDLSGSSPVRRLTFGGNNRFPVWFGNDRLIFQSDREADAALFVQSVEGGTAERLTKPDAGTSHAAEAWSEAADALLYRIVKGGLSSLSILHLSDRTSTPFGDVKDSTLPTNASFSPDRRWVAYQTGQDRSVTREGRTFVQPYPATGTPYQIAEGGRPVWSRDGKELFYIPAPGALMARRQHATEVFDYGTAPCSARLQRG